MKKLLLFVFLTGMLNAFAQGPVLTSANTAPVPGDVFVSFFADTTNVPDASSGPDQTWDYSAIQVTPTQMTMNWVEPSSTPSFLLFPEASVCHVNSSGGAQTYSYAAVNDDHWSLLGTSSIMITYTYTDPEHVFEYPFSFESTFTDQVIGTGMIGTTLYVRNGARTLTGEGWGKLILPGGTFDNVLLVGFVLHYVDSSALSEMTVHNVGQAFYDGLHKVPLLQIYHASNTLNGQTVSGKFVTVGQAALGTGDPEKKDIFTGPNPADAQLTIRLLPEAASGIRQFFIYDIQGKQILSVPSAGEITVLDVRMLPAGLYFIHTGTGMTAKFLKK